MKRIENWKEFSDSLIINKVPFESKKTSLGVKFYTPFGDFNFNIRNENSIPLNELYFIKKVKDYCELNNVEFLIDRETIQYIQFANFRREFKYSDCIEIDLSSAYWNFALREKIISQELYDLGNNVSKKTRLASLGALAKLTYNLKFNGSKWNLAELTEGTKANYFFRVAEATGEIMNDLKHVAHTDFIFFWVDAIFIKKDSEIICKQYLEDMEIPFKSYNIDYIQFNSDYLEVSSEDWRIKKESKTPIRKFYLKKNLFDLLEK